MKNADQVSRFFSSEQVIGAVSTRQAILLNLLTVVTSTKGVSDYNAAPLREQALFLFDYVSAFGIKLKSKKSTTQKALTFSVIVKLRSSR